ncbi:uncharacterized protein [Cicer arietinum]|uniref:Uncharacterized protein LOC113787084 n=1 Tax=Cicer arietinum TaxID=3827 RepID=A0A3Q7Y1L1_CICAR|nr:uncharacterized protein LOC113787084 [Cicer arietinum]
MDLFKEKQDAMEVNMVVDVSSPKANNEKVDPITPDNMIKRVDSEFQSPPTLTVVRKQLSGVHIDFDNASPRTPKGVIFDPFAPGPEDILARAPHSRKYHEEMRNNAARKLHFCSSPLYADSVSNQKQ